MSQAQSPKAVPAASANAPRQGAGHGATCTALITLEPLPPFRLDLTALALQRRRNNEIDVWDGSTLRRVMPASASGGALDSPFLLEVTRARGEPGRGLSERLEARVTGTASVAALAAGGERAARDLLGLDLDLSEFYALAAADEHLAPLAARLRGLKPPRYPGPFEGLVNAVPCQQMTLTFGLQLVARLARAYGPRLPFLPASEQGGPLGLPSPEALASAAPEALAAMGFSRAKARALIELGAKVASGELDLRALEALPDEEAQRQLGKLFGVGRWTSEYVLLRALGRLNVFPDGDSGARNGLARFLGEAGKPTYAWVAERVAAWQPYAGFVYLHLLVDGATRREGAAQALGPGPSEPDLSGARS